MKYLWKFFNLIDHNDHILPSSSRFILFKSNINHYLQYIIQIFRDIYNSKDIRPWNILIFCNHATKWVRFEGTISKCVTWFSYINVLVVFKNKSRFLYWHVIFIFTSRYWQEWKQNSNGEKSDIFSPNWSLSEHLLLFLNAITGVQCTYMTNVVKKKL